MFFDLRVTDLNNGVEKLGSRQFFKRFYDCLGGGKRVLINFMLCDPRGQDLNNLF